MYISRIKEKDKTSTQYQNYEQAPEMLQFMGPDIAGFSVPRNCQNAAISGPRNCNNAANRLLCPEIDKMLPFLGPEIVKMLPRNCNNPAISGPINCSYAAI